MMTRSRQFWHSPRSALGAVMASALLITGIGFTAPSGASSVKSAAPSAFCQTLISLQKVKRPATSNLSNYRTWINAYLPTYQKLASEAPSGNAKVALTALVAVLQHESQTTSRFKLGLYIATHSKQFLDGWKEFAKAAMNCVTQTYG